MSESNETPVLTAHVRAERTHVVIPSLPHWIEPTVEFLRSRALLSGACQETRSGKLLIALHEAITNAIIHGNLEVTSDLKEQGNTAFAVALAQHASDPSLASRNVDIVVDYNGDVCHWIITDQGRGFDVEQVLARSMSDDPDILLASGRGILMMKSFLDDVRFELGGRRVILTLERDSGAERRGNNRVPMNVPFQVTPINANGSPDWAATYEAVSRNFSTEGISLLQRQLNESGKILIAVPTDAGILHIPAEVKHSRMLGSGGMELGCQFAKPLAARSSLPVPPPVVPAHIEEVHNAVTAFIEGYQCKELPTHERRVHPRVVFNERVRIFLEGVADPIYGYARDLSKGGLAMITQELLPSDVIIAMEHGSQPLGLKVRCRIVRCQRIKEGFYDVGVAFKHLEDVEPESVIRDG